MTRDSFKVISNEKLNLNDVYKMQIEIGKQDIKPGQFVNVTVPKVFLPRPISVADYEDGVLTLIYRVVGEGTNIMSELAPESNVTLLTGLGNGFDLDVDCKQPLVVGGGLGSAPLYYLTKKLIERGKNPTVVLGFKKDDDIFYFNEFFKITENFAVTLEQNQQLVTDVMKDFSKEDYDYVYACGPKPMLKAVSDMTLTDGEVSLEERMGCGVGMCKCCSIPTNDGMKTLCHDGPVLKMNMVRWK